MQRVLSYPRRARRAAATSATRCTGGCAQPLCSIGAEQRHLETHQKSARSISTVVHTISNEARSIRATRHCLPLLLLVRSNHSIYCQLPSHVTCGRGCSCYLVRKPLLLVIEAASPQTQRGPGTARERYVQDRSRTSP